MDAITFPPCELYFLAQEQLMPPLPLRCYVTAFNGSMTNVVTNGHTLYVNGKAMN